VALEFGAACITEHPFTPFVIQLLVDDARQLFAEEEATRAHGSNELLRTDKHGLKYLRPMPEVGSGNGFTSTAVVDPVPKNTKYRYNKTLSDLDDSIAAIGDVNAARASTLVKSLYEGRHSFDSAAIASIKVRQSTICNIL